MLRAVNRILSDEDQPNTTINRLWDILDQPELNRAHDPRAEKTARSMTSRAAPCGAVPLVRTYMGWPVMIGDWSVPMWVSWIGLVVAGGLAFFGLRLAERDAR